jgi:ketosteroid isomerase-like protein
VGTVHLDPTPFSIDRSMASRARTDPWVAIVAASLADYAAGDTTQAIGAWAPDITWTVRCGGTSTVSVGPDAVLAYHTSLSARTAGSFRQELLALEGSGGPVVAAHVRTTAHVAGRDLDIPSLLVLELARGRIRRVTEIHGDPVAWEQFWG